MEDEEIDAIYSENLDKSFATLKIFEKLWRKREVILGTKQQLHSS